MGQAESGQAEGRRAQATRTGYRTYKVPEGLAVGLEEVLWLQRFENLVIQGHPIGRSLETERLSAWEAVIADKLGELRSTYWTFKEGLTKKGDYTQARFEAVTRDNFRCVLCRHSDVNCGGVESHHIIPRSSQGRDVPENLATLCHRDHAKITNAEDGGWHWRAIAPELFRRCGVSEDAAHRMLTGRWGE